MKRFRIMVHVLLVLGLFVAVGFNSANAATPQSSGKLNIVCTTFPQYDWVRQILGDRADNVNLSLLLDSGVDLHSYQPTALDMIKVSVSDLFVYVGGVSDVWVADALKQSTNPGMVTINLVETLGSGAKVEELIEGMEPEDHDHSHGGHEHEGEEAHDHDDHEHEGEEAHGHDDHEHEGEEAHGHDDHEHEGEEAHGHDDHEHEGEEAHGHDDHEHEGEEAHDHDDHEHEGEEAHGHDDHEHEGEEAHGHDEHEHEGEEAHGHSHDGEEVYDEHVWLSVKNAGLFCTTIADALVKLDPANADTYRRNLAAYTEKLADLDAQYEAATKAASVKTLLFGDRFPFRYLVDDYGLSYYAAFLGCSAETEASFETIVFLANKVDELGLKNVITLEGSDQKIAKTIIASSKAKNQRILTMDAMQTVTAHDVRDGLFYFDIMEKNLGVLKEALR